MKKSCIGVLLLLLCILHNDGFAQPVERKNLLIDPYYGWPNIPKKYLHGASLLFTNFNESSLDSTFYSRRTSVNGAFGIKAEYLIQNRLGIGIDFCYTSASLSGKSTIYNSSTKENREYSYKVSYQQFASTVRASYHLGSSLYVDQYVTLGVGYYLALSTHETDNPTDHFFPSRKSAYNDVLMFPLKSPLSYRAAYGARFFLSDNGAINVEAGIGGPLISAGLTFLL